MNASEVQIDRRGGPSGSTPPVVQFAARVIEGNYFYVCSALLMMAGCYLLMHSPVIQGTEFTRTLKTLLILQAYEFLLIATAIVIVRRLKVLDDAFTLLVLELVLLLDPTFFSNSFFTMRSIESTTVNAVCFLLVPIKLCVLQKALHLRLSPGMFGAFLFACAVVFLAEGPLNLEHPPFSRNGYYYLLGWMPLVVALLLPPLTRMIRVASERANYMTDARQKLLGRFLMFLPVGIVTAHFIESSFVYSIHFYAMYVVPLVLTVAVLMINSTERTASRAVLSNACVTTDVLCVIALVLSVGFNAFDSKITLISRVAGAPPAFIHGPFRIVVGVVAIIVLYLYFYLRLRYRPALYRVVAIAAAGCGFLLVRASWPVITIAAWKLYGVIVATITGFPEWLWGHVTKPGILAWAVLLILAVQHRKLWTCLLLLVGSVCWFFNLLPATLYASMPELPECIGVLALVLDHLFLTPKRRGRRHFFALAIVTIGITRFCEDPAPWTLGIAVGETLALIAAGFVLKHAGYVVIGLLAGGALSVAGVQESRLQIPPAVFVVAGGLVLFAVGVFVTFNKQRMLDWLQHSFPPAPEVDDTRKEEDRPGTGELLAPEREAETTPLHLESETEHKCETRSLIEERLGALFSTDPASGIYKAEDLDPQKRAEIISSVELANGEELAVCIEAIPPNGDWLALMTTDRVIAIRGAGSDVSGIGYDEIALVSVCSLYSLVLTDRAGGVFRLRDVTGVQAGCMKMALDAIGRLFFAEDRS